MILKIDKKHPLHWLITLLILLVSICSFSCMKKVITQKVTSDSKPPVHVETEGDSTGYTIGFHDEKELNSFTRKFQRLLDKYTFDTVVSDTINNYFYLRILPEQKSIPVDTSKKETPDEKPVFTEIDILPEDIVRETDTAIHERDTITPVKGGTVVIYTEQKFFGCPFSEFLQVSPFSIDISNSLEDSVPSGYLTVDQISPTKIQLTCTENLMNSAGKKVTAFNIVQAWTKFIKSNPAEGKALFYRVKGIKKFIKGEEAIIRGFTVASQKKIIITLTKPDTFVMERLNSPRLLPWTLGIGQFSLKNRSDDKVTLKQNTHFKTNKSFLNQCTIICGNDKKPIISYSLKKYDMIILYTKKDIEYASRSLLKNSYIIPFSTDRYFISLSPRSVEVRTYLVSLISPQKIQQIAIKAEGDLIQTIESNSENPLMETKAQNIQKPIDMKTIRILYNIDDPISLRIAERIYSDLSSTGVSGKLVGLSNRELQIALIDKSYEIAIGWIPEKVITDKTERLRLAAIWFDGENDESRRISENREIPLFTVKKSALCKNYIQFYKNRLTGIFRRE